MKIRFVSSLTPDDEARLAPRLVEALSTLLDAFPLSYTLQIETDGGGVFQHSNVGGPQPARRRLPYGV